MPPVLTASLLRGSIKPIAASLIAIGMFSVAFLASQAPPSQSSPQEVAWVMFFATCVACSFLILWMVIRRISKDLSGIVITGYIAFVFYGYIQKFINDFVSFEFIRYRFFFQDRIFLPATLIAIVLIYYLSKRFVKWNPAIASYVAIIALVLALWNLAFWGNGQLRSYTFAEERAIAGITLEAPKSQFAIYWMLFDGYGRDDVLAREFDFDNSSFLSALENRGFTVYREAITNCSLTGCVLPAMMELENFGTLDKNSVRALAGHRKNNHWRFEESAVVTLLSQIGYKDMELSSERSPVIISEPFPMAYYEKTGLSSLQPSLQLWRKYPRFGLINNMRETASQAVNDDVVVFSYNLPPHPPYYFDAEGKFLDPPILEPDQQARMKNWDQKDAYIGQLKFVNSQILTTVDEIIENTNADPLIIIMSDHGPASNWNEGNFRDTPSEALFNERVPILKAVRIPKLCKAAEFDKSSNSWNTFAVVLNGCFNAGLPIYPDDVWWNPGNPNQHYENGIWKPQLDH